MNIQDKYMKLFPGRKALYKGKATKAYEEWLLTQEDPFLKMIYGKELEATEKQYEQYQKDVKAYKKKVKANEKMKPNVSLVEIEQMSHPKKVEAFLNGKSSVN